MQGKPAEYTIRFVNDDDTELQSSKVPWGETPTYSGATPTKAESVRYSYEFAGWTPEVVPVTGNAVYKATYAEKAKPGVYEVTSGAAGTWTEGSTDPLVFVFKRTVDDETTIDHFTGIQVDAQDVPQKDSSGSANYTVTKGSAIVSLQPALLGTLAYGDHMLKVSFDDGNDVEVPFKTVAGESSSSGTKDDDETGGTNSNGTSGGGVSNSGTSGTSVSGNDGGSSSGTNASVSGTSGATTLARTGDASGGAVVWLVVTAACAFLLAALPRGRRNG